MASFHRRAERKSSLSLSLSEGEEIEAKAIQQLVKRTKVLLIGAYNGEAILRRKLGAWTDENCPLARFILLPLYERLKDDHRTIGLFDSL